MKETKQKGDAVSEKQLDEAQGAGIQFIPVVGLRPRTPRSGDAIMDNLNDDLRDTLD